MITQRNIVLIHGWGLNSAIWRDYVSYVGAEYPQLRFHCLDIPGYGLLQSQASSSDLTELAKSCLSQAPDEAVWVGWSLGGMIAMRAAMLDQVGNGGPRIQALQLINTSAKFVSSPDWKHGVEVTAFRKTSDALITDYDASLRSFLLLQAGGVAGARGLAKAAAASLCAYPNPLQSTLEFGAECLAHTDLRLLVAPSGVPSQVVCGSLDRVSNPAGTRALADMLDAELVTIECGHAPFLTDPQLTKDALIRLLERISIKERALCS